MDWDLIDWPCVDVPNAVWENRTEFKLTDEVLDWLAEKAGEKQTIRHLDGNWRNSVPIASETTTFYFRDPNVAMLFRLTFG
jgi:hypothetical protein